LYTSNGAKIKNAKIVILEELRLSWKKSSEHFFEYLETKGGKILLECRSPELGFAPLQLTLTEKNLLLTTISHDFGPKQPVHINLLVRQRAGSSRLVILKQDHIYDHFYCLNKNTIRQKKIQLLKPVLGSRIVFV
jgi:hypothetical protein